MKKLLKILLICAATLLACYACMAQQKGGAGHANGYYTSHISVYLAADSTTSLTTASTYYPIKARFTNGNAVDFTLIPNVGIKYTHPDSHTFIFFGSSNAYANKSCTLTYGLFKNSEANPVNGGVTPVTFSNANSYKDFSINRQCTLTQNDTLKFKMMSSFDNTDITIKTLNLTIIQIP